MWPRRVGRRKRGGRPPSKSKRIGSPWNGPWQTTASAGGRLDMIALTVQPEVLKRTVARARERGITIPTFAQMVDPTRVPGDLVDRLADVGLWDVNPLNLYRISWHNEPVLHGGGFGPVHYLEFPPALTGGEARIIAPAGQCVAPGAA